MFRRLRKRLRVSLGLRTEATLPAGLHVGDHTYFGGTPSVRRYPGDHASVYIGRYCSIAHDVEFLVGGNHRMDWVTTYPLRWAFDHPGKFRDGHPTTNGDILIGNDVWIGTGALILSGVEVGDGAVIAARAVVTRSVPPYAVVAGNPARVVRRRFSDEQIGHLLDIEWWNWPRQRIEDNIGALSSGEIDDFITAVRQQSAS